MQRREALQSLGALMLSGPALLAAPTSGQRRPRVLFFSRSVLFEHPVARIQAASPRFPGWEGLGEAFSLLEEWFSLVRFAKDMHVVLVQDCAGMNKDQPADRRCYDRPPFPATWARMYGRGRVFYTSLGHREDVWTKKLFQQILLGELSWAPGRLEADITPNLDRVAPRANEFTKP